MVYIGTVYNYKGAVSGKCCPLSAQVHKGNIPLPISTNKMHNVR